MGGTPTPYVGGGPPPMITPFSRVSPPENMHGTMTIFFWSIFGGPGHTFGFLRAFFLFLFCAFRRLLLLLLSLSRAFSSLLTRTTSLVPIILFSGHFPLSIFGVWFFFFFFHHFHAHHLPYLIIRFSGHFSIFGACFYLPGLPLVMFGLALFPRCFFPRLV